MGDSLVTATKLPHDEVHFYEALASNTSLPDDTVVYSTEEGIKYKAAAALIGQGALHDSSVEQRETIDGKKSREDFYRAVAHKFGIVSNYAAPTEKESEGVHNELLTLGWIRTVIREATLQAQVENLERDPLFARNPHLTALTARLIQAKQEAALAEAELDRLGCNTGELISEFLKESGKLLLDAGITAGLVGVAAHVVCLAAIGIAHAGLSSSMLGGSIIANLIPKLDSNTPWPTIPQAATRVTVTGAISIAVVALANIDIRIGTMATFIASSQDARAHISNWIDGQLAKQGFTFKLNKISDQVGALFEKCNINITTSYERTKNAFSEIHVSEQGITQALINAITTRALVNGLSEEIQQLRVVEEMPGKITKIAASNDRKINDVYAKHGDRFSSKERFTLQTAAARAREIHCLSQKIEMETSLLRQDLEQLSALLKENIEAIQGLSEKLRTTSVMQDFLKETTTMQMLVEEYTAAKSEFLSEKVEEGVSVEAAVVSTAADTVIVLSEELKSDFQEFSKLTMESIKEMKSFLKRNKKLLGSEMKAIGEAFLDRMEEIKQLAEELQDVSLLTQERLQRFIDLAKTNLATIATHAAAWEQTPFVQTLKRHMEKVVALGERLETAASSLDHDSSVVEKPILESVVELKANDFFAAIATSLKKGSKKIENLQQREKAQTRLVDRPYTYSGPGGPRWKM